MSYGIVCDGCGRSIVAKRNGYNPDVIVFPADWRHCMVGGVILDICSDAKCQREARQTKTQSSSPYGKDDERWLGGLETRKETL